MKPWHLIGSVYGCLAASMLVSGAACSSSSGGIGPATDSGSGAESSTGMSTGPAHDGTGMACTPHTDEIVGTKITLKVNWPQTLANAGCVAPACSGDIIIWLLSHYQINGTAVTGTTTTCSNQTPPIPLTALGSQSEGLPMGKQATVQINIPQTTWAKIAANTAPVMTTGTLGGWKVGASMQVDPTVTLQGIKPSSSLSKPPSMAPFWPCSQTGIMPADLSDDDMDGKPGITAEASTANGDSLPATNLVTMAPFAPQADKLYLAVRNELRFYGESKSCTDTEGTAEALLFNNHVIGCHIAPGMTCADSTCDCTMDEWNFIDGNTTVYVGEGVTIPSGQSTCTGGFGPPGIMGTFKSTILSNDPDGGGVDCAAVLTALP